MEVEYVLNVNQVVDSANFQVLEEIQSVKNVILDYMLMRMELVEYVLHNVRLVIKTSSVSTMLMEKQFLVRQSLIVGQDVENAVMKILPFVECAKKDTTWIMIIVNHAIQDVNHAQVGITVQVVHQDLSQLLAIVKNVITHVLNVHLLM